MSSEPDPDRLRALEERLAKAKGPAAKKDRSATAQGFSQGEMAWRMVIELASGIVIGLGIGYGLDWLFGTLPIFLTIFVLLGFAAGVRTMMGTARQMQDKAAPKGDAENGG